MHMWRLMDFISFFSCLGFVLQFLNTAWGLMMSYVTASLNLSDSWVCCCGTWNVIVSFRVVSVTATSQEQQSQSLWSHFDKNKYEHMIKVIWVYSKCKPANEREEKEINESISQKNEGKKWEECCPSTVYLLGVLFSWQCQTTQHFKAFVILLYI